MPQITVNVSEKDLPELIGKLKSMKIEESDVLITSDIAPEWHEGILQERLAVYKTGNTRFTTIEQLEKELNNLDESQSS